MSNEEIGKSTRINRGKWRDSYVSNEKIGKNSRINRR